MKNKNCLYKRKHDYKISTKKRENNIAKKAKNTEAIKVIHKKSGKFPEIKIISNVFKLKKAIVKRKLSIVPYQTVYIVCKNKNLSSIAPANIILTFNSIYGDLILVDIDKKQREFKSLSQEDIEWYTKDLINKMPIQTKIEIKTKNKKDKN